MTREEFRDKKSKDYRKHREAYGINDPVYLDEIEEAYYQGMIDADKRPHWISVEERKPKLKYKSENTQYSEKVIVTDGEYRTSANWVHNIWAGWYGWFTDGGEELTGITHWMPMPQAPTCSEKPNNSKKGGEE